MPRLRELVRVLRSKNAGPFQLTYDLLFADRAGFERAERSGLFTVQNVARLLDFSANEVVVVPFPPANAIKITVPRPHPSGSIDDTDIFGCQQHAPLLDLEIP